MALREADCTTAAYTDREELVFRLRSQGKNVSLSPQGRGQGEGSAGEELLDASTLTPTLSLDREREQVVSTSET